MNFLSKFVAWFAVKFCWKSVKAAAIRRIGPRVTQRLVVKYDEIMNAIHHDKVNNKPGVYVFVGLGRGEHELFSSASPEAEWNIAGFIVGKNCLYATEKDGAASEHILSLLCRCDDFAVGRILTKHEDSGKILTKLRAMKLEAGEEIEVSSGAKLISDICGDFASFIDSGSSDNLAVEPSDIYASMKLLFEHRGE